MPAPGGSGHKAGCELIPNGLRSPVVGDHPIAREFGQATTLAEGYEPALGSPELAGTLHAFATDWSIHRARLLADLERESSLADTAVKSYHGTDEELAAALRKRESAAG